MNDLTVKRALLSAARIFAEIIGENGISVDLTDGSNRKLRKSLSEKTLQEILVKIAERGAGQR